MDAEKITTIIVDSSTPVAPIKIMNAVNNGPLKNAASQSRTNFFAYKSAAFPYARIHDANHTPAYGAPHTVDITAIFPNFDADENDPASYDFANTDAYLDLINKAGTEVFYRLGQSIENGRCVVKKDGANPPKDFGKWARICEHIMRHYLEGWADGKHMKITYWEIWNEPDLGVCEYDLPGDPSSCTWTGTMLQFFELYSITAKHLKKAFPNQKIGGPALAGKWDYAEKFLDYISKDGAPLDFFSWHRYTPSTEKIVKNCKFFRELLDKYGFSKTESILGEWNYVHDWSSSWTYTLEVESGRFNLKSAALCSSILTVGQDLPVDMLMYYDARVGCAMNGLFHNLTQAPLKAYYPFYAWDKLRKLGTQVKTTIDYVKNDERDPDNCDIYAVSAANEEKGKHGLLVSRYNIDNNIVYTKEVAIRLEKGCLQDVTCHLTDDFHTYTEVPVMQNDDGSVLLTLYPNSFAYLEW